MKIGYLILHLLLEKINHFNKPRNYFKKPPKIHNSMNLPTVFLELKEVCNLVVKNMHIDV